MPLVFEAEFEFTQGLNEIMGTRKEWRRRGEGRDRYAEIILYFFIFCAEESVERREGRQRRNSRGWRETLHARFLRSGGIKSFLKKFRQSIRCVLLISPGV